MDAPPEYDIFISYSRDDATWVRASLYEPLLRCRTRNGRIPRVFFDTRTVEIGANFVDVTVAAIHGCQFFVPVYSPSYNVERPGGPTAYGKYSSWELKMALNAGTRIMPVRLTPQSDVPLEVGNIHWVSVLEEPDWFQRLRAALELDETADRIHLEPLDQPQDVMVNHTLPPLRVAAVGSDREQAMGGAFVISVSAVDLQGTLDVTTVEGVAVFEDLAIRTARDDARLVFECEGLDAIMSDPFRVVEQEEPRSLTSRTIPARGAPVFFAQGRALAVIGRDDLRVFGTDGTESGADPVLLSGPVRVIRRDEGSLVLALWSGEIIRIAESGEHESFVLGDSDYQVPGDVAIVGGVIYVGFWNGLVYRIERGEDPRPVLRHDAGVHAIGVTDDVIHLSDSNGRMHRYRAGRHVGMSELEPIIWGMKVYGSNVVAFGERRLYRYSIETRRLSSDAPLKRIVAVLDDPDQPIVVDHRGKGIQVDADLTVTHLFRVPPGAVPVDADAAGVVVSFLNPDGSCTVRVRDDRGRSSTVFAHRRGAVAVSPEGALLGVEDEDSILLVDTGALVASSRRGEA